MNGNPIIEVGGLAWLGFVREHSRSKEIKALLLEGEVTVGVLGQKPGSIGTVLSDQTATRPPMLGNDLFQPFGVVLVDVDQLLAQLGIDRPAKRVSFDDQLAHALVFGGHGQKGLTDGCVQHEQRYRQYPSS